MVHTGTDFISACMSIKNNKRMVLQSAQDTVDCRMINTNFELALVPCTHKEEMISFLILLELFQY